MVGRGVVVKTDGEYATVRIKKSSACAHSCDECRACENPEFETRVLNTAGASVGDAVLISTSAQNVLAPAFLTYVLPVAGSFLAYAAASKLPVPARIAAVAAWLGVWVLILRRYSAKKIKTSSITEVINEKN